jgi:4-amino-4-deoxychorismate lyase
LNAAKVLKWDAAYRNPKLQDLYSWRVHLKTQLSLWMVDNPEKLPGPYKIRVLLNKAGNMRIEYSQIAPTTYVALYPTSLPQEPDERFGPFYDIVLDTQSTEFNQLTWLKTTSRQMYDSARLRMTAVLMELNSDEQRPGEILMWNDKKHIMEGSITNVYFWRDEGWITPFVGPEYGGLEGTSRRWAVEHGLCKEALISLEDMKDGELVWISNGVRGFLPGRIAHMTLA